MPLSPVVMDRAFCHCVVRKWHSDSNRGGHHRWTRELANEHVREQAAALCDELNREQS